MCPFGYDNITTGLCLGWFIGTGSFGCLVFGYLTDRTGKLEEISKILYAASSLGFILLVLVGAKLVLFRTHCSNGVLHVVHHQSTVAILDLLRLCLCWLRLLAALARLHGFES